MNEAEFPVPATTAHHRDQVRRRARRLVRRRRLLVSGTGAVIGALVVGVVLIASNSTSPATTRRSQSAPAVRPRTANGSGTSKTVGKQYVSRGLSSSGPSTVRGIYQQPSGTTQTITQVTGVLITLAPPLRGHWGTPYISRGRASSLTIQESIPTGPSSQALGMLVSLRTESDGTATISIPDVGAPSGTWTVTIVVKGSATPCGNDAAAAC